MASDGSHGGDRNSRIEDRYGEESPKHATDHTGNTRDVENPAW